MAHLLNEVTTECTVYTVNEIHMNFKWTMQTENPMKMKKKKKVLRTDSNAISTVMQALLKEKWKQ